MPPVSGRFTLPPVAQVNARPRTIPLPLLQDAERAFQEYAAALDHVLSARDVPAPSRHVAWAQDFAGDLGESARALAALHLALLAARLLRDPDRLDPPEVQAIASLLHTLADLDVRFSPPAEHLWDALGAAHLHPRPTPARDLATLSPILQQAAQRQGMPLPDAFQPGSTAHAALTLQPPASTQPDDFTVSLRQSRPPGTPCPTPRMQALLDVQDALCAVIRQGGDAAGWAYAPALAAGLLLVLHDRAQHPALPVPQLLTAAAALCQGVLGAAAQSRAVDAGPACALLQEARALHADLGRPRVRHLAPHDPVPLTTLLDWQKEAMGLLVHASDLSIGRLPAHLRDLERQLWFQLDVLETLPAPTPAFRLACRALTASALTHTPRHPDVPLPTGIELACAVHDLDPGWASTLRTPDDATALGHALNALSFALNLLALQRTPAVHAAVHQAVSHLLAVCRRVGVQYPDAEHLDAFAHLLHPRPLAATPLSPADLTAFHEHLSHLREGVLAQVEPHEDTPDASSTSGEPERAEAPEPMEVTDEAEVGTPAPPAGPLERVRGVLSGKRVVLLGGVPYPAQHEALVQAFDLADLDWIPADRYDHGQHAHAHVQHPDTALVLFALRWAGHAHNGIRDVARAHGIPCVLLPGGLSPNQVAFQVEAQASRCLYRSGPDAAQGTGP